MPQLKNIQDAVETLKDDAVALMPPLAMLGVFAVALREMFSAFKPPPEKRMD